MTGTAEGGAAAPVEGGAITGAGAGGARASQRIGLYEVLLELGRGGMGMVYLARTVGGPVGAAAFERLVAIKRMHAHLLPDPDAVGRFHEEASVAARIHHANVVGIHQVGSDEGGLFLVQDYVEGDSLDGLVDGASMYRERLPPPIVLRIAVDALAGLHAVHEARDAAGTPLGILHRDIATQNLLIGLDGVTRVADFGIAKQAMSSVVTDSHYLRGRALYMAPEYLRRQPIDRRLDLYAMGVTMWVALAGSEPWPDAEDAQIIHLATTVGVPPLSASGLEVAPAIEAIIARACDTDPSKRFATAREMLEAIEQVGRHTGWIASHGEVAAVVERLSGKELAARHAALAKIASKAVSGPPAKAPETTVAPPASPSATPGLTPRGAAPMKRRNGIAVAAAITTIAALAAGAAALGSRRGSAGPAAPTSSRAEASAPPVGATAATIDTNAPPAIDAGVQTVIDAGAPAVATARPVPALPSTTSAAAANRRGPVVRSTVEPGDVPATISTVNPYK